MIIKTKQQQQKTKKKKKPKVIISLIPDMSYFFLVNPDVQTDNNISKFEQRLNFFEVVLCIGKIIGFRIRHICLTPDFVTYSKMCDLQYIS